MLVVLGGIHGNEKFQIVKLFFHSFLIERIGSKMFWETAMMSCIIYIWTIKIRPTVFVKIQFLNFSKFVYNFWNFIFNVPNFPNVMYVIASSPLIKVLVRGCFSFVRPVKYFLQTFLECFEVSISSPWSFLKPSCCRWAIVLFTSQHRWHIMAWEYKESRPGYSLTITEGHCCQSFIIYSFSKFSRPCFMYLNCRPKSHKNSRVSPVFVIYLLNVSRWQTSLLLQSLVIS